MRVFGRLVGIAGAALLIVAVFLPYIPDPGDLQDTYYELSDYGYYVLIAVAGLAALLLIASFFAAPRPLAIIAAAMGGYLLGATFFLEADSYESFEYGFWLLVGGGLATMLGALMAALPADPVVARGGGGPVGGSPVFSGRPAASSGEPSAGWYPDPSGGRGQRYWSGSAWTDHTR